MYQQPFEFFWPLTEQIPLDLDYTPCIEFTKSKHESQIVSQHGTICSVGGGSTVTSWASINALSELTLDVSNLTIQLDNKPNIVRGWLFKLLDIKWKVK